MADDHTHPRPDQAEEPADDIGASNVDLDEARHGPAHVSPAVPEPEHQSPDGHAVAAGQDDHDAHDVHPVEDPKWVLLPLLLGAIVAVVILVLVGVNSGASPFHQL